jgi:hypothetical protein
VWHGLGALGGRTPTRLDKITTMVLGHGLLSVAAAGLVVVAIATGRATLVLGAILLVLAAPAAAVVYRTVETRRVASLPRSIFLYTVYFFARVRALATVGAATVHQRVAR